jgi:hypothetical protein
MDDSIVVRDYSSGLLAWATIWVTPLGLFTSTTPLSCQFPSPFLPLPRTGNHEMVIAYSHQRLEPDLRRWYTTDHHGATGLCDAEEGYRLGYQFLSLTDESSQTCLEMYVSTTLLSRI